MKYSNLFKVPCVQCGNIRTLKVDPVRKDRKGDRCRRCACIQRWAKVKSKRTENKCQDCGSITAGKKSKRCLSCYHIILKLHNVEKICLKCGEKFWVRPSRLKKASKFYCSIECYKPNNSIRLRCKNCGIKNTVYRNRYRDGRGKFCNLLCYSEYAGNQKVSLICPDCLKVRWVPRCIAQSRKGQRCKSCRPKNENRRFKCDSSISSPEEFLAKLSEATGSAPSELIDGGAKL